jgi:hypothetical protein
MLLLYCRRFDARRDLADINAEGIEVVPKVRHTAA